MQIKAESFAVFLVDVMAFDAACVAWEGAIYGEPAYQRLSAWYTGEMSPHLVGSIVGDSAHPELCVRMEFIRDNGKVTPMWLGLIPQEFLTDDQNLAFNAQVYYDDFGVIVGAFIRHVSLVHQTTEFYTTVITQPEVTTLNKRRRRVPYRNTQVYQP